MRVQGDSVLTRILAKIRTPGEDRSSLRLTDEDCQLLQTPMFDMRLPERHRSLVHVSFLVGTRMHSAVEQMVRHSTRRTPVVRHSTQRTPVVLQSTRTVSTAPVPRGANLPGRAFTTSGWFRQGIPVRTYALVSMWTHGHRIRPLL